jgi:hypothetical protein
MRYNPQTTRKKEGMNYIDAYYFVMTRATFLLSHAYAGQSTTGPLRCRSHHRSRMSSP